MPGVSDFHRDSMLVGLLLAISSTNHYFVIFGINHRLLFRVRMINSNFKKKIF